MEGKKYISLAGWIIISMHLTGILGLVFFRELFLGLVWFHLVLSAILVFVGQKINKSFLVFSLLVFSAGFLIEVAGVRTGDIFGEYTYGDVFGFKLWETPLLIGLNWLIIVYCAGMVVERAGFLNGFSKVLAGSILLVIYDLLLEPVAIGFGFWDWQNEHVPIRNYFAWALTGGLMLTVFRALPFEKKNILGFVYLTASFFFLISLNLLI